MACAREQEFPETLTILALFPGIQRVSGAPKSGKAEILSPGGPSRRH